MGIKDDNVTYLSDKRNSISNQKYSSDTFTSRPTNNTSITKNPYINSIKDILYGVIDMSYNGERLNNSNHMELKDMDKILEKYIDKMDRDQSDLRNDIRTSENRTTHLIEKMEERIQLSDANMEKRMEKIEKLIENNINQNRENSNRLESKIDNNNKFIISISISVIIGVAAMVISVISMIKP